MVYLVDIVFKLGLCLTYKSDVVIKGSESKETAHTPPKVNCKLTPLTTHTLCCPELQELLLAGRDSRSALCQQSRGAHVWVGESSWSPLLHQACVQQRGLRTADLQPTCLSLPTAKPEQRSNKGPALEKGVPSSSHLPQTNYGTLGDYLNLF